MTRPMLLMGAPGTGKTQRLIQEVIQRTPYSFAFLSFTRRAANEAKQRLAQYCTPNQLKYVRTIHSLCFELAGLNRQQIMNEQQVYKFANDYGYDLHPRRSSYEDGIVHTFMSDDDIEFRQMNIDMARLDIPRIRENPLFPAYNKYLKENNLIDYHQMIALGTESLHQDPPKFDLLLVDEFQDLTPIQLAFIGNLKLHCKEMILAGDDNQMIFEWAGVDRNKFIGLAKDSRLEYLHDNYRLPAAINELAVKIALRQMEPFIHPSHTTFYEGDNSSIEYTTEDMFNFEYDEQYLVLARNSYLLDSMTNGLELEDREWSWLDEEKDTKIKVSTIHGAKGTEADNVVLYTDVSPATYEHLDTDAEHRVWYVAVTRAKKKLIIIQPNTDNFYDLG